MYVNRPAVVLPPHRIPLRQIIDDIMIRHADLPRIAVIPRVLGQLPAHRHYSQPFEVVTGEREPAERIHTAFDDITEMGLRAARATIAEAGLRAGDIDCVVTVHGTGEAVPGLDVFLHNALGLRPEAACRPASQLGCAGGAHALAVAAEFLSAHPGATVLVVLAESLSSLYHHTDVSIEQMIYKALWGDSAVACLVTDRPLGPGLRIEAFWEYLLPHSAERYRKRVDRYGVHFDSEKSALRAVPDVLPALRERIQGEGWELDFIVSHTGGPRILEELAGGLELEPDLLRHSWDCLNEQGNLGGPSVLAVLERTHRTPPAHGDRGMLLGFGPGFRCTAARATWWVPEQA
ncbi:PhlD [Kitasatospora sp. NPDC052896]|uniref:PhlD n=1 Tax=Kitasatospora sp. NPDC052896 TaxID=3364061 RepID=UPI0037C93255